VRIRRLSALDIAVAVHPDQIRRHDDLTIAAGGCGTSA